MASGEHALAAVLHDVYLDRRAALPTLQGIGLLLERRVKELLSQPGGGRVYTRRGREHQASAPGEPPAVDLGTYRASFTHAVGVDGVGAYVEVGTNDQRGPWLEGGTSTIEPRPHVSRAVSESLGALGIAFRAGTTERLRHSVRAHGGHG